MCTYHALHLCSCSLVDNYIILSSLKLESMTSLLECFSTDIAENLERFNCPILLPITVMQWYSAVAFQIRLKLGKSEIIQLMDFVPSKNRKMHYLSLLSGNTSAQFFWAVHVMAANWHTAADSGSLIGYCWDLNIAMEILHECRYNVYMWCHAIYNPCRRLWLKHLALSSC